jgi:hypothetical protein
MELPAELREWAKQLVLLEPELSLALGSMVRRLSAAIGSASGTPLDGEEEADGFSGLATRGPYERLLPSEWLLAEELPHEFQRRAAMAWAAAEGGTGKVSVIWDPVGNLSFSFKVDV